MTATTDPYLQERRLIARTARASLMSDTKWRKLLVALDRDDLRLDHCIFKFIDAPEVREAHRPPKGALHPPHAWIDTIEFGPIRLRTIEWLLFPRVVERRPGGDRTMPVRRWEQDVEKAAEIIAGLGEYPIVLDDEGLRVIGHLTEGGPTLAAR